MAAEDNIAFWERVARVYAPFHERANRAAYERVAEMATPLISRQSRVLEIGCGSGQFTTRLAHLAGSWRATDFSPKMVDITRQRIDPSTNVIAEVQDATSLYYDDGMFNTVFIANVLHVMPRPDLALREIVRVTTPDALVIAPTYVYEGKINRPKLWLMEKTGFRTFHKWTATEYRSFLTQNGLKVEKFAIIPGNTLPQAVAVCRKREIQR